VPNVYLPRRKTIVCSTNAIVRVSIFRFLLIFDDALGLIDSACPRDNEEGASFRTWFPPSSREIDDRDLDLKLIRASLDIFHDEIRVSLIPLHFPISDIRAISRR